MRLIGHASIFHFFALIFFALIKAKRFLWYALNVRLQTDDLDYLIPDLICSPKARVFDN